MKLFISFSEFIFIFLSVIWLAHDQHCAIIEGQPHSPDFNHCIIQFRPVGHREPRNKVGSIRATERQLAFEQGTFQFYRNALTH